MYVISCEGEIAPIMNKDFDAWNMHKKNIEYRNRNILFKTGEVWWVDIGINIGSESCGAGENMRRPVLIIKKLSANTCICLPITRQKKQGSWFCGVRVRDSIQYVLLHQIRMLHSKRFQCRLETLNKADFNRVKEKLEILLELSL